MRSLEDSERAFEARREERYLADVSNLPDIQKRHDLN
jgi:hypothetical protein